MTSRFLKAVLLAISLVTLPTLNPSVFASGHEITFTNQQQAFRKIRWQLKQVRLVRYEIKSEPSTSTRLSDLQKELKKEVEILAQLVTQNYVQFFNSGAALTQAFVSKLDAWEKEELTISLEEPAAEVLRPMLQIRLMREVWGLKGEANWSGLFYVSRAALRNYYNKTNELEFWLHRNPAPEGDQAFLLSSSIPEVAVVPPFNPTKYLWSITAHPIRLNPNEKFSIRYQGKNFTLFSEPKKAMDRVQAENLIRKVREELLQFDYAEICSKKKVKAVFAFGDDSNNFQSEQLKQTLKDGWWASQTYNPNGTWVAPDGTSYQGAYEPHWESIETKKSQNLKGEFLTEFASADYTFKGAHQGGKAAIFRLVNNGVVIRYKKILEPTLNQAKKLYEKCGAPKEIQLEVVIIETTPETNHNNKAEINGAELMQALVNPPFGSPDGQSIFFDGSCVSINNVPQLYTQWIRNIAEGKTHKIIPYFSNTNQNAVGMLAWGLGSVRFNVLDGITQGMSLEEIYEMPHLEGNQVPSNLFNIGDDIRINLGAPIDPNVIQPIRAHMNQQDAVWQEVLGKLTADHHLNRVGRATLKRPDQSVIDQYD